MIRQVLKKADWALEVDGMDGRRAGSCPLQLQVRIGPVWRISSSKGTAMGMSLELTCVVSRPTQLERTKDLGRSDEVYLSRA